MFKFVNRVKLEKVRVRYVIDFSKDINRKKENININELRVRFKLELRFVRSDLDKLDKFDKDE